VEPPPLTNAILREILDGRTSDAALNALLALCLGYRRDPLTGGWDTSAVPEVWRRDYPEPPDFIGHRPAVITLTRSIPEEHKQLLKQELGFAGYRISELTPDRTRRATAVNWLLSHRKRQT
jgi:hypothetical protein